MKQKLIKINPDALGVLIDLRYASRNNFTKQKIYKKSKCLLIEEAFERLIVANEIASSIGYKIKIFDAFRSINAQKKLWDILPNPEFISPPSRGSPHSRGIAIDITLVDSNNIELDMGTEFDEFSKLSYHGSSFIPKNAIRNRLLLLGIMTTAGWDYFRNEWWHYQLYNSKSYPLIHYEDI